MDECNRRRCGFTSQQGTDMVVVIIDRRFKTLRSSVLYGRIAPKLNVKGLRITPTYRILCEEPVCSNKKTLHG